MLATARPIGVVTAVSVRRVYGVSAVANVPCIENVGMRFVRAFAAASLFGSAVLSAQSAQPVPRWEAGISTVVGISPLVGGTLAFQVLERSHVRLAVEVSGFAPLLPQRDYACVNASWSSQCSNPAPLAEARALGSAGLRASLPLTGRWYAVAEGGLVHGRWRYPEDQAATRAEGGLGLGRESRSGTRSLELRWQRMGTSGVSASAWRLGWSQRW